MSFPLDAPTRVVRRAQIRGMHIRAAEITSHRYGRSSRCLDDSPFDPPRHAGDPDGCRNDGSGCLCECHDGGET
jgi:hypothetical protein